jgi:sugar phosphate permease
LKIGFALLICTSIANIAESNCKPMFAPSYGTKKIERITKDEQATRNWEIAACYASSYVVYVCMYVARKPVSILKHTLRKEHGVPLSVTSWMDGAWLVAYAVGKIVSGLLVDIVEPRHVLLAGGFLAALSCAAYTPSLSATLSVMLWTLNGFGQSAGFLAATRWLTPLMPVNHRSLLMSAWETSQNTGGMAGAFIGKAETVSAAFAMPAFALFLSCAVLMVVGIFCCSDNKEQEEEQDKKSDGKDIDAESAEAKVQTDIQSSMRIVVCTPGLGWACVSYSCVRSTRYLLMFWLPYFFADQHLLGKEQAAYVSCCCDVAGILGTLLAGRVHDLKLGQLSDPGVLSGVCLVPGIVVILGVAAASWSSAEAAPSQESAPTSTAMDLVSSVVAVSLVAAGAEVADYLMVGPTALALSIRSGHGEKLMGRIAGVISGLAALVCAIFQVLAVGAVGGEQQVGARLLLLIAVLQLVAVLCLVVSWRQNIAATSSSNKARTD